jgi:hypothetical protein
MQADERVDFRLKQGIHVNVSFVQQVRNISFTMNDRAHINFSARNCMASLKIKYAAIIISSLIAGLISGTVFSTKNRKKQNTERKVSFSGMTR